MQKARQFVRREYPDNAGASIVVRVTHGVLGDTPCVVFEQEGVAFGGGLFSSFEAVVQLYEVELKAKRLHPGRLRFVQCRHRAASGTEVGAVYEEVSLKTAYRVPRYAAKWEPVVEKLCFSASAPTPGWFLKAQRPG